MAGDAIEPTLRQVRDAYLARSGLSTAAYTDRWVTLKVGPIPLGFPSTKSRREAIRYHDLHHSLTGYHATPVGEAEIGAWEIATGCKHLRAAWVLNLAAMGVGIVLAPRRVWRAFVRGRRTGDNLYGREFGDALLDRPLAQIQAEIKLAEPDCEPAPGDRARFVFWCAAATVLYLMPVAALAGGVALAWWFSR